MKVKERLPSMTSFIVSLTLLLASLVGSVNPATGQEPQPSVLGSEKLPFSPESLGSEDLNHRIYLPLIATALPAPPTDKNDVPAYVNYFRAVAQVPVVTFDTTLDDNCYLHARYMAEENHLTHDERPDSPWYTPQGQVCAQRGNAWLGGASVVPYWQPYHSIKSWMGSTGHRLWLLYPTTPVFGYGFYTASNNRAGAALDVLSYFNPGADISYPDWPIRYPGLGQSDVPARAYPITLNWRYFGPTPTVSAASLTTANGTPIAHTVTTALPVGHKGIQITPEVALPARTTYIVSVTGTYDREPFTYTWSFSTGD